MKAAAPERYLGLVYADYPEVNGRTVNEMARKGVTSTEVKQQVLARVEQGIASSIQSRTADWDESDRETAHETVTTYIEQQIQETFTNIEFK